MAAYGYEAITVSSTAIGFTTARITDSLALHGREVKQVIATVETNPIRFTVDGTTPTTTVGHLLNIGDTVICDGEDARKFRAIATGSDASLKCTFEN